MPSTKGLTPQKDLAKFTKKWIPLKIEYHGRKMRNTSIN
jgi:hypothetical protein